MPRKPKVVADALVVERQRLSAVTKAKAALDSEVGEPTSTYLHDYTIIVTCVENNWWRAQLKELPGVITTHQIWSGLRQQLQDALMLYQLSRGIERP